MHAWLGVLLVVAPLAEAAAPKQEEGGPCEHDKKPGWPGAEVEHRAEGSGGRRGLRVALLADERGQMMDERREDSTDVRRRIRERHTLRQCSGMTPGRASRRFR